MSQQRAPKQWPLMKNETINSFENWRQNLLYILSLDRNFSPFLADDCVWEKRTSTNILRGFTDDGNDIPEKARKTAIQKKAELELMLGQIEITVPSSHVIP